MLGYEPLPWDNVECLGDILADLGELGSTTARARRRYGMNHASTRQMIGKLPSRLLGAPKAADLEAFGPGGIFARSCGQLLELQLHLINQALAALGTRAKRLALHLSDHEMKMFDQRLGTRQLGACFDQRGLERL